MQGSRASPSHRTHTNHPPSAFQHWHYRLDGNILFCLCLTIPYHHSAAAGESWRRISKRCHCKTVYITIKYKGTAIVWQHWHEEEDKDVDDDGPVYVMNQKTAIGHGIARVPEPKYPSQRFALWAAPPSPVTPPSSFSPICLSTIVITAAHLFLFESALFQKNLRSQILMLSPYLPANRPFLALLTTNVKVRKALFEFAHRLKLTNWHYNFFSWKASGQVELESNIYYL